MQKQLRTSRQLTARARELTAAEGLAGFTVQQLCDEVGVSRRTFFNYFPSKEDAVLGISRGAEDEHVATFLADRSGDLVADLIDFSVSAFEEMALTPKDVETIVAVLHREPALLATMLRSAEQQQERYVDMIAEREGLGSDRVPAEVAVKVIGGLVELSAKAYFSGEGDSTVPFREILRDRLAAASILLADSGRAAGAPEPTRTSRPRPKDLVTTP